MELSAIALEGMHRAETRLERTAGRLAQVGTASAGNAPADTVSLSDEMVSLLSARNEFAIGARVLETAQEIERNVLDILG